ncbi:glutathione S-transferase family protein [Agaribacterium haliotis]|uniref:glutathione S-transferase family protein n=1 Tax=Agaribacterium haliotis TaxID=2013869 RepID=UPI000BB54EF6|nr:glutathione S-transferase family protein [Agaribacterium haliotis]
MYTVYGDKISGNCYKIKLMLELLGLDYHWQDIDILKKETHSEDFLAMNANAKVPVLKLDDGRYLSESNAILAFLADNTDFLPQNSYQKAKVFEWLFFEQYSHEPYIAVARFIQTYLGLPEERRGEYESKKDGGYRALALMNQQLQQCDFLCGDTCSIADISLYAYTHVADEGGFDLTPYRAITTWFKRIEQLPNYCAMR